MFKKFFLFLRRIFLSAALPPFANAHCRKRQLRVCTAGRLFLFGSIFALCALPAFSSRVISPVEGRFANRQCLILELGEGEEAFYSYTDTNPLESGFAYDGLVLIDVKGAVSLRVVVVSGENAEEYRIDYTVSDDGNPFADGSEEKALIDRVMSEGVLPCVGGDVISVPASLSLRIGDGEKPASNGGTLAVSADNRLSRYIPCNVSDGERNWRFVIFLTAGEAGTFSKADVPFELSDWSTFRFTGKNLIWSIDDGYWSASKDSVTLDRSKTHVIYWQDVAYKAGNPIQSFVLPPKPAVLKESFDKAVVFSISGDMRYRLSLVSSGAMGEARSDGGLYTTLTFDTFAGDCVNAEALFALYCDGVYQGEISIPYVIDRQPPLPPKFIASEVGEYARHDVRFKVESENGADIYLALYGPFEVSSNSYLDGNSEFDRIKPADGDYFLYKAQPIELRAGTEKAVCYKAFSYAKDISGNISALSSYKVIIDEYNYFLDGNASDFAPDGSRLHPYNSFEQALRVINEGKFVHFFISGSIPLPKGMSLISSNCSFTGMGDARFILPPSAFILVQDASLEMQNCVVQKDSENGAVSDSRFFVFERGAASFEDCEILGNFGSSGTVISADSSAVSFRNSGLTVQSRTYACGFSGNNSKLTLSDSHFASVSDTAVNFSVKGGSFELKSCDCTVISHLGRILESNGAHLRLVSNSYTGDFDRETKGVSPVWKDEKTLVLEEKNNTSKGF